MACHYTYVIMTSCKPFICSLKIPVMHHNHKQRSVSNFNLVSLCKPVYTLGV